MTELCQDRDRPRPDRRIAITHVEWNMLMPKRVQGVLAVAAVMGLSLLAGGCSGSQSTIYINEFMASNLGTEVPGAAGQFPDWIELYCDGEDSVNLDGYSKWPYALPTKLPWPCLAALPACGMKACSSLHWPARGNSLTMAILISARWLMPTSQVS